MFAGEFFYKMDKKGRVVLPPQFVRQLGREVFIVESSDGCLCLCPLTKWGQTKKEFEVLVQCARVEIRKCGDSWKVLVPRDFGDYAGLKTEVMVCGCKDYIELWDKEKWAAERIIAGKELAIALGD